MLVVPPLAATHDSAAQPRSTSVRYRIDFPLHLKFAYHSLEGQSQAGFPCRDDRWTALREIRWEARVKRFCACILFILLGAATARAQLGLPSYFYPQFFNPTTGQPLSSGFLYSCSAGQACPGTPLSTFADAGGSITNGNPIPLDLAGRPSNGVSLVGVWMSTSVQYKFVLQDSAHVTIATIDNVSAVADAGGGGGGGTNYWTLNGSTISNNNGAGAGDVAVGAGFFVNNGNITLNGTLKMKDASTHYAILRASNVMVTDVTWRWPAADAVGCLESDGVGNLSFTACGGGGGGGSPGGPATSIQYNGGVGTFSGTGNFVYTAGTPDIVGLTGVFQAGGTTGGFSAPTATAVNAIQAPAGGVTGKYLVATDSMFFTEEAPPAVGGASQAKLYADSTSHNVLLSKNGGTFKNVATNTGALTNGNCVSINGAGDFVDAGGPCTTGGGGGTVSSALQYDIGYYATAGTTISGSAGDFIYTPGSPNIVSLTGSFQAGGTTGGFNAPSGTAANAIQAPVGGVTAKWLVGTDSLFLTELAAPAISSLGQARIYADSTTHKIKGSFNNAAYVTFGTYTGTLTTGNCVSINSGNFVDSGSPCGGGGGGGSPAGTTTSIQWNNAGTMAGTYNGSLGAQWDDTNKKIILTTAGLTAAIDVAVGYIQTAGGFITTSTANTAINASVGGIAGKFLIGTDSLFLTEEAAPALSAGGQARIYADNSAHTIKVSQNGGAYTTLGGVSSVNSLTGTLTLQGTANQVNVSSGGSTITLSAPQNIATSSSPTFASVTANGVFNSTVTGSTEAFKANGSAFSVHGDGTISGLTLNLNGGSGNGVNITASTSFNSIQSVGGANLCSAGACASGNALTINGVQMATSTGYWTGFLNTPLTSSSVVYIGSTGNFYDRAVGASSTSASCGGVADGWMATYLSDQYLVVCLGGSRYRASLVAF